MGIYIIIAVAVIAVLAFLFGFYRGYAKLSCWGGVVIGTVLVSMIVNRYLGEFDERGIVMLAIAAFSMVVLTILCQLVRRYILRQMKSSGKLSFYRQYDDRTENDEHILVSLDKGDKKKYRKYSKRKFSESRGAWGVVDRVFGGITFAVNTFVALAVLLSLALFIIDAAQITVAYNALSEIYENPAWTHFGFNYCLDIVIATLLCMCIRLGYKSGFVSALGTIVILGLFVGAGYLGYYLAFNVPAFASMADGLREGALAGVLANVEPMLSTIGLSADMVAKIVVAAGLFIVFAIVVIIIAIFIPHAIEKLRKIKFVMAIDGVVGAIVLTGVVFFILLAVGAFVYEINDLAALKRFNDYMNASCLAKALYNDNIFNTIAALQNLPIRSWFGLKG